MNTHFLKHTLGLALSCSPWLLTACGSIPEQEINDTESVAAATQALDSARARVINECSQAMTGNWWTYTISNWPTSTTYGTYAYISSDTGAWGKLLDNTYNCIQFAADGKTCLNNVRGWWTSCRSTTSVRNYTPCLFTAYGDLNTASQYDCQGSCTSGINHRGGQCKPFMNLIAYRSGIYQNPGYAWKAFPSDSSISTWSTAADQMPYATYSNILEGDYLRRPYGHALIIVRKISSSQVIVLDSNWSGGNGGELISSHSMAFGTGNDNNNLGAYRVLKCTYTGAC